MVERQELAEVVNQVADLLDRSVVVDSSHAVNEPKAAYPIIASKKWDLSTVDFDKLKEQFNATKHKHIAIADMRAFLDKKLLEMLKQNSGRIGFAERYQKVIENYNAGATATEQFFEELQQFTQGLQTEEQRHIREGLTEDELEIYDLLLKEKLTKAEEQQVKLAAKDLIIKLIGASPKVLIQDWWKDAQTQAVVKSLIEDVLDKDLPNSYEPVVFKEKVSHVFDLLKTLAMNDEKWASVPQSA
jgi:type I restriction enzyme R subunit